MEIIYYIFYFNLWYNRYVAIEGGEGLVTKQRGALAVIISAIVFGSMPLMAKIVYQYGSNPISLVFYRFSLVLPFLFFWVRKNRKDSLKVNSGELKKIIIVSVFGYATTALSLFISYIYIPSGMATTIHFTYPIFVILGCIAFFKEKTNIIEMVSVILCFLGIIAFYDGSSEINLMGIGLAFISGITYAFYTIYIDKSGLKEMGTIKLTFYLCLISSIIILIFGIITQSLIIDMKPMGWIISISLSILAGIGGVNLDRLY